MASAPARDCGPVALRVPEASPVRVSVARVDRTADRAPHQRAGRGGSRCAELRRRRLPPRRHRDSGRRPSAPPSAPAPSAANTAQRRRVAATAAAPEAPAAPPPGVALGRCRDGGRAMPTPAPVAPDVEPETNAGGVVTAGGAAGERTGCARGRAGQAAYGGLPARIGEGGRGDHAGARTHPGRGSRQCRCHGLLRGRRRHHRRGTDRDPRAAYAAGSISIRRGCAR